MEGGAVKTGRYCVLGRTKNFKQPMNLSFKVDFNDKIHSYYYFNVRASG